MHFECDISSIHFPHPREDEDTQRQRLCIMSFNPLPSSEGRQYAGRGNTQQNYTSIHFPHPREDDIHRKVHRTGRTSIHFPHPREDRPDLPDRCRAVHFNPLPSSEGRLLNATRCIWFRNFNPLPSSEGRLRTETKSVGAATLQSTSLIRGKTLRNR